MQQPRKSSGVAYTLKKVQQARIHPAPLATVATATHCSLEQISRHDIRLFSRLADQQDKTLRTAEQDPSTTEVPGKQGVSSGSAL